MFFIGRFSANVDQPESDSTAADQDSGAMSGAGDSRAGSRRKGGSLSERIASGSIESVEEELGQMMGMSNWPQRRDVFAKYMENFTPEQGPAFVAAILESNKTGAGNHNEWNNMFFHWGEKDPQSALAFLENADTSEWKHRAKSDAMFRVYLGWSEINSPAAFRQAEESGYLDSDRTILGALISNWAQQDTTAVTQHIVGESREDLYGYLGAITEIVVRQNGTEGLIAWQRDVISKNPQLGDRAGSAVAAFMGGKPPEAVAAWLVAETKNQEGHVSSSIARQAYQSMKSSYPQRSPQLLAELSRHESANNALQSLVAEEVQRSPDQLKVWLQEREDDASVARLREVFESVSQARQGSE